MKIVCGKKLHLSSILFFTALNEIFEAKRLLKNLKNATGTITFVAESRSRIRPQDFRNSESEPTKKDLAPHITGGGSSYARQ